MIWFDVVYQVSPAATHHFALLDQRWGPTQAWTGIAVHPEGSLGLWWCCLSSLESSGLRRRGAMLWPSVGRVGTAAQHGHRLDWPVKLSHIWALS